MYKQYVRLVGTTLQPSLSFTFTFQSTLAEWRVAFWVCFVILVGTNIVYIIWADGKQQWWDDVRQYGYPPGWKHGQLIPNDIPDRPDEELRTAGRKD